MAQAEKIRLDIPVLLPSVADVKDLCVKRLVSSLSGRPGISEVHVTESDGLLAPQLCIHYEPGTISLQRVRELAATSGAALSERFAHMAFQTSTQHARAARRLSDQILALTGVLEAEVATTGSVRIEFDRSVVDEARVKSHLDALGLAVNAPTGTSARHGKSAHSHDPRTHGATTHMTTRPRRQRLEHTPAPELGSLQRGTCTKAKIMKVMITQAMRTTTAAPSARSRN